MQSCNTNGIPLGRDQRVYNFFLGADQLGRDPVSRIIYGARISLTFASIAIACGTVVGTTLGLIAGYYGGYVDELIMRATDVFTAVPYVIVAISIVIVLGQSFLVIVLVLTLASWPGIGRSVRGQTLQTRNFDYIAVARVSGASTRRIMYKHLLPAVANTIVVAMTLQVGITNLTESILSFLGTGIPPPTPSWGRGHLQWARVPWLGLVDSVLPRHGDLPNRAVVQLHWRLAARSVGSEVAAARLKGDYLASPLNWCHPDAIVHLSKSKRGTGAPSFSVSTQSYAYAASVSLYWRIGCGSNIGSAWVVSTR